MDQLLGKEIAKVSFRSISTDMIQSCLCNAYPRNQAVEHEMQVKSICYDFQCETRAYLTGENRSNLDFLFWIGPQEVHQV